MIRRVYYLPIDLLDIVTGKRDKNVPPKGMIFIGSGDFKKIGNHYLDLFKTKCQLKPEHRVLDIGCGIGRIALPLTTYLNADGSYDGFDIVKRGIDWCKKNISTRFPNFRFIHIDLKNDLYNLSTEQAAKSFVFPYKDHSFDLIVLTSVFTHMLPEDVENYLKEISRVLDHQGKCLATFFILNEESKALMQSSEEFNFKFNHGQYSLLNEQVKEANIAFEESYLQGLFVKNQLTVEKKFYGFWSGRPKKDAFDFQDTIILSKQ